MRYATQRNVTGMVAVMWMDKMRICNSNLETEYLVEITRFMNSVRGVGGSVGE